MGAVNSIFYQKRFWCLQTQYRKSKKSVLPYFFSRYRNFDYSLSSVFRLLFTTIIIIIIIIIVIIIIIIIIIIILSIWQDLLN